MARQKNYFGKSNISPSFPGAKKPVSPADPTKNAKNTLIAAEDHANSNSLSHNDLSSHSSTNNPGLYQHTARTAERNPSSLYYGTGKTRTSSYRPSAQKLVSRISLSNFLKASPAIAIVLIIIVALFAIFGSTSLLGPHISALFTEATNIDYTAYNLRANELFAEILDGKLAFPDQLKSRLESENIKVVDNKTLQYNGETITSANFINSYNSNVGFREAVTYARRGRAATFFDNTAKIFYQKLGLSRDVLHDYQTTGNAEEDNAKYNDLMTKYFDVNAGSTIETATIKTSTDESGKETSSVLSNGSVTTNSSAELDAKTRAKNYLDSVGNKVAADSEGCATLTIGDMIATAIASNAKYTNAQSFMTKMENISKAMAGDGDNSAINSVLNWFTEAKTTSVYDPITGEESSVTGSPLEAEVMRTVLSGIPANQSKTKNYSLERAFSSTDQSIQNHSLSTDTCKNERATNTVISLSALAMPGNTFIRTTIGVLLKTGLGEGVRVVASSMLSLMIPTIADVLYGNSFTESVGISGGEDFGMGAANINQLAGQQNSAATGASKENVLAYNRANNITIAQQAEVDRKNYSPFDASNKNTFLGSIAHSLLPLATSSATLWSPVQTLSSISSTSLASINPTYADGENTSYLTDFGTYCNKVESIGAVGNMFCNMVAVNDLSTINITEDDPTYQRIISDSVDIIDGKEVVRDGSPLADFITYWMGRYSMPGVYDANIANACKEQITGNIPVLSDIISMVNSIDNEYCNSIADGSYYVNSSNNPNWETLKYYQLWALTTRVKENFGFYDNSENPLTAYRKHYDSLHPLDNSRSGYLARISGLTKDNAETVLAIIDYYQTVADYHPESVFAFGDNIMRQSFSEFTNHGTLTDQLTANKSKTTVIPLSPNKYYNIRREETIS